jgi:TolB-like protein/DNA-binding winged helix-turn-helix (wHTH) protein/Flp pilus assembly protein TadD
MPGSPILSFGPYQLDTEKVRLWCDTQPVRLTPKAFQVLCYVAERPGQLVTKEELFRVVWADTVVGDAALTMRIQEIRKALQDNAKSPQYLETVHRQGFRFIAAVTAAPVGSLDEAQRNPGETPQMESRISLRSIRATELDESAPTRFWSRNSLMLTGLLLLVSIIIAIQYLSLPTAQVVIPNLQPLTPNTHPLSLPDKPSIIVLPFVNLSGDLGQEYFSDGMTEEITAALSRLASLFVIARTSAFTYKGKATKVQDISREMGVRYVLEGSVRKTDGRLRVIAQLIDATTGEHLWTESYDRELKDIFAVQDEVRQKIVFALKVKLTPEEQARFKRFPTDNLEAYDFSLQGDEYAYRFTKEAVAQERQMYEKALALDPQYAGAYAALGWTYFFDWGFHWNHEPQNLERAFELAQKAVVLDDSLPDGHLLLGQVYMQKKQPEQALAEAERAIALAPNHGDGYALLATILSFTGKPQEAIQMAEKAVRLNPNLGFLSELGHAYCLAGRYEEAIATLKQVLSRNPNLLHAQLILAIAASEAGQEEEAQAAAAEVLRINPKFSLEVHKERAPLKDPARLERHIVALHRAGLK